MKSFAKHFKTHWNLSLSPGTEKNKILSSGFYVLYNSAGSKGSNPLQPQYLMYIWEKGREREWECFDHVGLVMNVIFKS